MISFYIYVVQFFVEPKNLSDVNQLFQINQLGWDSSTLSNYVSGVGLGYFSGGFLAKWSLTNFGQGGHTTLTHLLSVAVFLARGSFQSSAVMWATLVVMWLAETRQSAVKAMATDIAIAAGMGKGKVR